MESLRLSARMLISGSQEHRNTGRTTINTWEIMMKHKWIVSAIICLFITTLSLTSFAEDSNAHRRDGNWWLNQSTDFKLSYLVGFLDGMGLGNEFSYWDLLISNDIKKQCYSYAIDSYTIYSNKYMSKVTDVKIVDGLNAFYSDSKNSRILVLNAVWLVVNGIAGTPQKDLDAMIEGWRNNSQN